MTIKPKNEYREPITETVYIKQEMDDSNFNENSNNFLPLPDPNFIQVNEHFVDQKNSNRLVSLLVPNFTTRWHMLMTQFFLYFFKPQWCPL